LFAFLDKQPRPYKLQVVNSLLDFDDECPIYQLRIAKKDLKEVI
jgi:hypothetical protein